MTQNTRLLKATVIGLGVLIVLGFIALIVGIVIEAGKLGTETRRDDAEVPPEINLGFAPETAVEHVALDGRRVAIQVRNSAGARVLVLDVERGRLLGSVVIGRPDQR